MNRHIDHISGIAIIEVVGNINYLHISEEQDLISLMRQCDVNQVKSVFKNEISSSSSSSKNNYTSTLEPCTITSLNTDYTLRVINDRGNYFDGKVIKNFELFTFEQQGYPWTELPIEIVIIGYQKINNRTRVYVSL